MKYGLPSREHIYEKRWVLPVTTFWVKLEVAEYPCICVRLIENRTSYQENKTLDGSVSFVLHFKTAKTKTTCRIYFLTSQYAFFWSPLLSLFYLCKLEDRSFLIYSNRRYFRHSCCCSIQLGRFWIRAYGLARQQVLCSSVGRSSDSEIQGSFAWKERHYSFRYICRAYVKLTNVLSNWPCI